MKRSRLFVAAGVLMALAALLVLFHASILRGAGWMLVSADPVGHADAVVVPQWAEDAGAIQAADLVHRGLADRVAVLVAPIDPADQELIHRGIISPNLENWYTRLVRLLGVSNVEQIQSTVAGTETESEVIPEWCVQHGVRSVIVVSTPDHSRRVRRVLRRTVKGRDITVMVSPTWYGRFDPNRWWKTRDGMRTEIVELQKLALEILRHPLG